MSYMVNKIKKEIKRANPDTGMLCGHPKVTLDVADVERLLIELEAATDALSKMSDEHEKFEAMVGENNQLRARNKLQYDTLNASRAQFMFYAANHAEKGNTEKQKTNLKMAFNILEVIEGVPGQSLAYIQAQAIEAFKASVVAQLKAPVLTSWQKPGELIISDETLVEMTLGEISDYANKLMQP